MNPLVEMSLIEDNLIKILKNMSQVVYYKTILTSKLLRELAEKRFETEVSPRTYIVILGTGVLKHRDEPLQEKIADYLYETGDIETLKRYIDMYFYTSAEYLSKYLNTTGPYVAASLKEKEVLSYVADKITATNKKMNLWENRCEVIANKTRTAFYYRFA